MPKESYAYVGSDEPAPGMGLGFSDQAVRRGFIRKVSKPSEPVLGFGIYRKINSDSDPTKYILRRLFKT